MTPSPDVPRAATRTAMDAAKELWDATYSFAHDEEAKAIAFGAAIIDKHQSAALLAANAELARVREEMEAELKLMEHRVITCGVAATHPDANLTQAGAYANKWNSQQADQVRALRADRDQWKTCAENVDRKMLDEQADHNKTVDRLLAERALADDLAKALERLKEDSARILKSAQNAHEMKSEVEASLATEKSRSEDLANTLDYILNECDWEIFGDAGDDRIGEAAKAALERHRGARGVTRVPV